MPSWTHHVFVCTNKRPPGHPKGSCTERGSEGVRSALIEAVEAAGLHGAVKVNGCSCLGPCQEGPTMVVYPEGTWYVGVKADDAEELVREHFVGGKPVERLRFRG